LLNVLFKLYKTDYVMCNFSDLKSETGIHLSVKLFRLPSLCI